MLSEWKSAFVRRITSGLMIAACFLGASCKASVNADAKASVSAEGEGGAEGQPAPGAQSTLMEEEVDAEPAPGAALLGARHDLRLSATQTTARCSCLAVAVGAASDPAFQWRSGPPTLDAGSQQVVALGSEGISCAAAAADSLGASYWGYRQAGADIEVVVETARAGRPLTHGAIIPKPAGHVLIVPLDGTVPYGRGKDGAACRADGQ